MNDQYALSTVAGKLIERWKTVMTEGQKAKDAQNELVVNIYQQERQFLEKLIDEVNQTLPTPLAEWEAYKERPAPDILFSPDSTFVQHRF
ncbi:hypothetical protein [Spirosoma fluviale]|uniref:Uncharacterized protein n=1 Tax=Spirosoma fluviale TaxID=1597977 RepID=A0A286FJ67_9BACT|nr:hypothetical protein [Spirosoma fluviale]SOD83307.1 hypothetical protein SAMN06269250_2432 [Spirosoma fluviale]